MSEIMRKENNVSCHSERSEESHDKVIKLVREEVNKSFTDSCHVQFISASCNHGKPTKSSLSTSLTSLPKGEKGLNNVTDLFPHSPVLDFLCARTVSPIDLTGQAGSMSSLTGLSSVRKSAIHLLISKKAAFTLAEVLITLGIIGVVAAMTLPTLIANYQKKQIVTQLKKNYSLITQAMGNAVRDYGEVYNWNFSLSSEEFADKYIKPYYNVVKTTDLPNSYHTYDFKKRNRDYFFNYFNSPHIILNDGTMLTIQNSDLRVAIVTDLNGFKNPNIYGKDLFAFSIDKDTGKIMPYGIGPVDGGTINTDYNREELLSSKDHRNCNRETGGAFCSALIMTDGWNIKDDYPW